MDTNNDKPEELTDNSRYIRTFAKDMAALQKQGGAKGAATPPPGQTPTTPAPEPKQTTDGVTLPQVDESLITEAGLSNQEEIMDLSDAPTQGSVSVLERKAAPPPPPAPEPSPVMPPRPVVPIQASSPTGDSERDAILARLKAKAANRAQAPIATPLPPPAPEPAPVMPPPIPVPPPAPAPVPPPPPVYAPPATRPEPPPVPPPPVRTERPVPPPPSPAEPAAPSPFHSYSTDFAKRIDDRKASTFSVLAAQADTKPREVARTTKVTRSGPKPAVLVAILLFVLGGGALAFTLFQVFGTSNETVSLLPSVPSVIPADEAVELTGVSGTELMRELREAASEPLLEGNVLITYITSASSTPNGLPVSIPQSGGALVKALPLLAPDILMRNIRPESTVGIVHAGSETRPFFILKVSSYERTFAGMLAWEQDMRASLTQLYPSYPNAPVASEPEPIATTTTSSTTPFVIPPPAVAPVEFVDAIVRNYDVRILRDADGRSLMLYGYYNKETLIIARDEAAFLELVTRLNAANN
ncbi:MAG TPA: hypothetical protein VNU47_01465 [Candidatus Paceibacterota bacterium]|nr:hypothetical protein [Candidatus Paceibacterota bacterium]